MSDQRGGLCTVHQPFGLGLPGVAVSLYESLVAWTSHRWPA
jgi:hypothetical protein